MNNPRITLTLREEVDTLILKADKAAYIAGLHELPKLEKDWNQVSIMLHTLLNERDAAYQQMTGAMNADTTISISKWKELPDKIDTSKPPYDGSMILVHIPKLKGLEVSSDYWVKEDKEWAWSGGVYEITHWMPMIPLPSENTICK